MFKKFLGGVALVAGIAVAGVVGFQLLDSPFTTTTKDHSPPPVLTELRDLSDFHAAQAQFEVTLDLEKDVKYVPQRDRRRACSVRRHRHSRRRRRFQFHRCRRDSDRRRQQVRGCHPAQPVRDGAGARPRSEPRHEP